MFSGLRLSLARKRAGLSKKGLAELLNLHPRTISRWESDDRVPDEDELLRLSDTLDFSIEYFSAGELDEAPKDAASFRSMSSMTAAQRDSALSAGAFGFVLGDWIESQFDLPEPDLEDLRYETPEGAARSLREKWEIGERPIGNMVQLLEAKGVRVFSLSENIASVDAFSMWRRDKPYVFLNGFKTSEHQRFDAAHELGHLVLHQHGGPRGRAAEDEANRFASSFLMPAADVVASLPMVFSIDQLIRGKSRWKVSLAALNYRVHKLKILSDWEYRSFCIEIQKRGYRKTEPMGIEREKSDIWMQVFKDFRSRGISMPDISEQTLLPIHEIENLVFGLAPMLPIQGGSSIGQRSTANLKVVVDNSAPS